MPSKLPKLYVISGAGLSAESGVGTFRSKDGTWARFDPARVCDYETWQENRAEVFEFYGARLAELQGVQPNAAHRMLAAWQARWGADRVHLLTQNVDTLMESAGASQVTHLHGDLRDLRCTVCDHIFRVPMEQYGPAIPCTLCGRVEPVKPGVIFFNERAPAYEAIRAFQAALQPHDVVLVIGTSFMVLSVEQLFPRRRFGSALNWQVNPEPDRPEWFALNVSAPATEGLARLESRLVSVMEGLQPEARPVEAAAPIPARRGLMDWLPFRRS